MSNSLVLIIFVGLTIVFLTVAVVYYRKIARLKKQLHQTRFNFILSQGTYPRPEKNLALFFDEKTNQFKPLDTRVKNPK